MSWLATDRPAPYGMLSTVSTGDGAVGSHSSRSLLILSKQKRRLLDKPQLWFKVLSGIKVLRIQAYTVSKLSSFIDVLTQNFVTCCVISHKMIYWVKRVEHWGKTTPGCSESCSWFFPGILSSLPRLLGWPSASKHDTVTWQHTAWEMEKAINRFLYLSQALKKLWWKQSFFFPQ